MTLLALDIGDKLIGVATGEENGVDIKPHSVVKRLAGETEGKIIQLIKELKVTKLIVGTLSADGSENEQSKKVENFCRRLSRRISIPIERVDEYLSTVEAKHRLLESGIPRGFKNQKGVIDAVSASIILQIYIQSKQKGV